MRLAKVQRDTQYKDIATDIQAEDQGIISGHANVFRITDFQNDRSLPGCFAQSIKDATARRARQNLTYLFPLLWSHDFSRPPLGGVISCIEDNVGLFFRAKLDLDTQAGAEAYSLARKGVLSKLSIGYRAIKSEFVKDPKTGEAIRNLIECALQEISLVVFAANDESMITQVKNQRSYAMPLTKDFTSSYNEELLEDWEYSDWSSVCCALQDSIQECFTDGGDPLRNLETNVIPGLASALREYVSQGVALGYTGEDSSSDYSMMSAGGSMDEKAGRVLSAATRTNLQRIATGITSHVDSIRSMQERDRAAALQGYPVYSASARNDRESKAGFSDSQHGILDKSTSGIMGHVRSLKSMAAVAARTNALRGWPIVRATSSDRSYFEEKEAEEETREMIGIMGASLEVQNSLRELRELREANVQENPLVSGVDAALARFLAATERT